jgi:hypothetical protein
LSRPDANGQRLSSRQQGCSDGPQNKGITAGQETFYPAPSVECRHRQQIIVVDIIAPFSFRLSFKDRTLPPSLLHENDAQKRPIVLNMVGSSY